MFDISALIDAAKERSKISSDRQLAEALGRNASVINQYRRHNVTPSIPTTIQLAEMAGLDPHETVAELLIYLNRNEDPKVVTVLGRVRDAARSIAQASSAAALALPFLISFAPIDPAVAAVGTKLERAANAESSVYIMGKTLSVFSRLASFLAPLNLRHA